MVDLKRDDSPVYWTLNLNWEILYEGHTPFTE